MFKSAHDALVFAYGEHSPNMPSMKPSTLPGASRENSLGGLDGAMQAGIIKQRIQTLGRDIEALITARYSLSWLVCSCGRACCSGKILNRDWMTACLDVAQMTQQHTGGNIGIIRECVKFYYSGSKYSAADIAAAANIHESTARRYLKIIRNALKGTRRKEGLDQTAYRAAEDALSSLLAHSNPL